jgi:SHS2 domain-containing protein
VWGRSLEELFANAAAGMFAQMVDLASVPISVQHVVTAEGIDAESLLVAWLSELLYLRDVKRAAYVRFQVCFPSPGRVEAIAEGGPWRDFVRPIKAVTYHGLKITRRAGRCRATIVFDV